VLAGTKKSSDLVSALPRQSSGQTPPLGQVQNKLSQGLMTLAENA